MKDKIKEEKIKNYILSIICIVTIIFILYLVYDNYKRFSYLYTIYGDIAGQYDIGMSYEDGTKICLRENKNCLTSNVLGFQKEALGYYIYLSSPVNETGEFKIFQKDNLYFQSKGENNDFRYIYTLLERG